MADAAPPDPDAAAADAVGCACDEIVLETEQRLSRSRLWQIQRRYFEQEGVAAWSTNTVPHYVTNNTALAHAYAKVVLGFLRDLAASPALDPAEPVTIVELGAGSGRFAHIFLNAFLRLSRVSPLAGLRVRYVVTDFTTKNVDFWRAHDALRARAGEGLVDFAAFDAEHDAEIRLVASGETLGPGSLRNPLVVVANYVFDGIRQDAFTFQDGALQECLVTLRGRGSGDPDDPGRLGELDVSYTRRPASLDYYGDPDLDDLLRGYAERLDGATVLFPCAAIRCLHRLADLSGGRILLLSGDKGEAHEDALRESGTPSMAIHGSFSMSVNYHAIAEHVRRRGGHALTTSHRPAHLCVSAFLLGDHPAGYPETRFAYAEAFEDAGPDELFSLRRGIQARYGELDLEHLVSLIRLTRCDPRILRDCLPALWDRIGQATEAARRELVTLIGQTWENYFHIGEDRDVPFEVALLLYGLGEPREALALFEASLRLYGDDPRTRWNMGLCHAQAGQVEEAAACFAAAAAMGFTPVGALQAKEAAG